MKDKKESKFEKLTKHLIHIQPKDVNLKFIFDNFRNYGIAASIIFAGFFLIKYGATTTIVPYSGFVLGAILLISGLILVALNFAQVVWAIIQTKPKMFPYLVFSLLMFFSTSEFVWVFIKVKLI